MRVIYSGHPKLCHQPDHTFINRVYSPPSSTKIRPSSILTFATVHLKCHHAGRQNLIFRAPFISTSLTLTVPTNRNVPHTHISLSVCVSNSGTHEFQLWCCLKSLTNLPKPGMFSPQKADLSANPNKERELLWRHNEQRGRPVVYLCLPALEGTRWAWNLISSLIRVLICELSERISLSKKTKTKRSLEEDRQQPKK